MDTVLVVRGLTNDEDVFTDEETSKRVSGSGPRVQGVDTLDSENNSTIRVLHLVQETNEVLLKLTLGCRTGTH